MSSEAAAWQFFHAEAASRIGLSQGLSVLMETTSAYLFTAWFQDGSLPPHEQDHEWPACFEVLAASVDAATAWGIHLSGGYVARHSNLQLLRHSVEALPAGPSGELPVVRCGVEASDDEIGW